MQSMQQDPLAQLKDIELPAEVGIWPPAWPWWLLALLIVLIIAGVAYYYISNRWRRQAINMLNNINQPTDKQNVIAINRLLKQVYIQRYREGHSLSGMPWLNGLDSKVKQPLFLPELADLAHAPDSDKSQIDLPLLRKRATKWIRRAQ